MIIILLSSTLVLIQNSQISLLKSNKKSLNATIGTSSNATNSETSSTRDPTNDKNYYLNSDTDICSIGKEILNMIYDIDCSVDELRTQFDVHLKQVEDNIKSSQYEEDKKRWRDDIKQQIDFTVEKVAELQKLRDSLEDTNNQVMNAHCNTNVTAEPIVPKSNVSNITNTTSPPNNTNINKATNNTTLINTTNNTNINNATNNTDINNATNNTNTSTIMTKDKSQFSIDDTGVFNSTNQTADAFNSTQNNSTQTTSDFGAADQSVTSFGFIQVLQKAATDIGLPSNYVQLKLKKLKSKKNKKSKKISKLKKNQKKTFKNKDW